MELLERYLQAVKFWLPREQKQDIIAELSEDIRSQIDERETELHHRLSDDELAALLKQRGNPMFVAQRYLPQRQLISPTLYPIYTLVLRMAAWFYFVPWFAVWLCLMVFLPSFRAAHGGVEGLLGLWASMWSVALSLFACVTVAFALVDRYAVTQIANADWDPRKLPRVKPPSQISRCNTIAEAMWSTIFLLWWVDAIRIPALPKITVSLAPSLAAFHWPMALFLLATIAMAVANALRPWWTPLRARVRLAIDVVGLVIVGLFLAAGNLAVVTGAEFSVTQLAEAEKWLTFSWRIVLAISAATMLARIVQDARRALGKEPYQNWAMRALVGE
jgi:hypothetical protein